MGPLIQVCVSRKIIISLLDENSGNGNGNGNVYERLTVLVNQRGQRGGDDPPGGTNEDNLNARNVASNAEIV